ncbi:hypothetical protein [Actinokineospora xionganensis]|uniref:Uncharacterized protein n=1 Tax=Actinokineospora xionganensis TaxID=2684470 RepID=A0ABR7LBZ5_9PSEU|nr:hypothetical protein [Actinokineospora xionganensis]MBC6450108.1 hypothetical protein [Actinokineospora xionganensis]
MFAPEPGAEGQQGRRAQDGRRGHGEQQSQVRYRTAIFDHAQDIPERVRHDRQTRDRRGERPRAGPGEPPGRAEDTE